MHHLSLLIAFALFASPATSETALPNGGFEKGFGGWKLRFGAGPEYVLSKEVDAHEGKQAGCIILKEDSREQLRVAAYFGRADLPRKPGAYRLAFALRTELSQGTASASINALSQDDENTRLAISGKNIPLIKGKTEWQQIEVFFELTEASKRTLLQLEVKKGQGKVWFDDLIISPCTNAEFRAARVRIDNGDFEKGLDLWGLRGGPGTTYQLSGEKDAFEGRKSAMIHLTEQSTEVMKQAAYLSKPHLSLTPGYYLFSFAMRTDLKQGNAGAAIISLPKEGKAFRLAYPGVEKIPVGKGKTPWKLYRFVIHLDRPVERTVLQMQVARGLGKVWFDSVSLVPLEDKKGSEMLRKQNPKATSMHDAGAKKLGEPCRIVNARIGRFVKHPDGGRNMLAINSCASGGGSAILVDYENNESRVAVFPKGVGGWDMAQIGPDRMLFESLGDLHLYSVDIRDWTIDAEREIKAGHRNSYAWSMDTGPDGKVYFGSYPTCHAYRFDPKTRRVEDLGKMGHKPNLYVRRVAATEDGWLLCTVGTENRGVVAYNIETGKQQTLEGPLPSLLVPVGGNVWGSVWLGKDKDGGHRRQLYRFNAETMLFEEPSLPIPQNSSGTSAPQEGEHWSDIVHTSTPDRLLLKTSRHRYYLVQPKKVPRLFWELPLRGGTLVGIDDKDRMIGYRGQDYFVAPPLAKSLDRYLHPIARDPPPVAIHFLRADPSGGVTGGPSFGQTLFRFDPNRSLSQNTPQVVDGGGEVYDGRWIGDLFYFIAYGGGDLGVWDPDKPWDQWNNRNPRVVAKYNGKEHHSLIRPQGGLVIGPGGRLYSGFSAAYGTTAGGITEYDPESKKARSWPNDVVAKDVSIGRLAADDRYVYGITSNNFNGLRGRSKALIFFVFDPKEEKVVYQEALPGEQTRPTVIHVPGTGHVWLVDERGWHLFDRVSLKFAQRLDWPAEVADPTKITSYDVQADRVWLVARRNVVRLDDGDAPKVISLFAVDRGAQGIAAGKDGQLYFTQQNEVWSVDLEAR